MSVIPVDSLKGPPRNRNFDCLIMKEMTNLPQLDSSKDRLLQLLGLSVLGAAGQYQEGGGVSIVFGYLSVIESS